MSNWLDTHFFQGKSPTVHGFHGFPRKPDCIINVDDRPFNYHSAAAQHWFPMPEAGCPLAALYGALVTLDQCRRKDQVVYLHCYAGVQRSRLVAECYRYLLDNTQAFPAAGAARAAMASGDVPEGDWLYCWLLRLGEYLQGERMPSGLLTSLYLESGPRRYQARAE